MGAWCGSGMMARHAWCRTAAVQASAASVNAVLQGRMLGPPSYGGRLPVGPGHGGGEEEAEACWRRLAYAFAICFSAAPSAGTALVRILVLMSISTPLTRACSLLRLCDHLYVDNSPSASIQEVLWSTPPSVYRVICITQTFVHMGFLGARDHVDSILV